jgi:hypothetical protein
MQGLYKKSNKPELNEAKSFEFTIDYNTEADDIEYIENLLKKAKVNAYAEKGSFDDEMIIKAGDSIELRKAKKAIEADGLQINEAREQIKRKYRESNSIRVNEATPIRNDIVRFVGKRFVTEEELKMFLSTLSENRGKNINARQWFAKNERYFESFQNRGQQVWTLSKYGKRVHEFINRRDSSTNKINESIGLFKSSMFESVNEAGDIAYWKQYEKGHEHHEEKWATEVAKTPKELEDLFAKIVNYWDTEGENEYPMAPLGQRREYVDILDLAKDYLKRFRSINGRVIDAMIMQES